MAKVCFCGENAKKPKVAGFAAVFSVFCLLYSVFEYGIFLKFLRCKNKHKFSNKRKIQKKRFKFFPQGIQQILSFGGCLSSTGRPNRHCI